MYFFSVYVNSKNKIKKGKIMNEKNNTKSSSFDDTLSYEDDRIPLYKLEDKSDKNVSEILSHMREINKQCVSTK